MKPYIFIDRRMTFGETKESAVAQVRGTDPGRIPQGYHRGRAVLR